MEHCAFITEKQADSLDKGFAKDGDVLITHKGTIGRTAILHCTYPYIMLTPQVTYYRPILGIIPEYLKAYFDTDYFQGVIANIASVGSTRAYIGITAQQELPLLIPALDRQREYAAFVVQTDKSKLAIQQSLDKLELLKKSLMQEYFG
jgi:type I restriction enzyme S subunit